MILLHLKTDSDNQYHKFKKKTEKLQDRQRSTERKGFEQRVFLTGDSVPMQA